MNFSETKTVRRRMATYVKVIKIDEVCPDVNIYVKARLD